MLYNFFPPHRVHDDETACDNCIDPAVSPSSSTIEHGFSSEDDMGDALEVAGENNREKGHRKAEGRGKGHECEKPAKRVRRDFIPSLATTKSKGRVEYFIDQVISNPFVSLEAEVDRDAKEDDDEDVTDEFETFLDDSEPVPGIQASSRSILLQEHERLYNETNWEELLDRTCTRSRIQFSPDGPGAQSIPAIFNIPLLGSQPGQFPSLWRIQVKPGFEEPVTTVLMNKIMRAGVGCWAVSTVIENYSRPGWIAVESKSHKDVVRLCSDVLNVYPKDVHSIDPSDAHLWLKMPAPYSPKPDTWVRLSKGRYKGDLVYVWDFDEEQWLATALVVPRLDYSGKLQKGKGKQKQKTQHSQGLFNQRLIKQLYGASSIERRNQVFLFQGRCFKDRYEELFTGDFLPEEAFPTVDERKGSQRP
ncbi:hypothetical protein H0H81_002546 [Sphagnurus paluster]|uniref:Uncharacterized protein n=1 Tax=Sphagnurus paluster TaxID=117069 RepID=A0A9P7FSE0_9AGAR|nr:hypothetical protein H0H81_002546 [Sphagnurus paluster]